MNVHPQLPGLTEGDAVPSLAVILDKPLDREEYLNRCRARWSGEALRDAKANWSKWQELRPVLNAAMLRFREQSESLNGFLWSLQTELQPDKARLDPLLDFCDHYQNVFLRRGLVIYCLLILRAIEKNK